jgi:hypothetical protein
VEWQIRYKPVSTGDIIDSLSEFKSVSQSTNGAKDKIIDTGEDLKISNITSDLLLLNIERDAATDSYDNSAQVHMVQYSYTAKNVV